jgi:Tfp pilus assembly protein PilV
MRQGFTLVEVLVALILFEIAMLALAGTAAVAARDLAVAHRSVRAQTIARNRLEALRASACTNPGTGNAVAAGGFSETWRVEGVDALRRLNATVAFPLPGGRVGKVDLETSTWCPL